MPTSSDECDAPVVRTSEQQEWVEDMVCGMEVAPETTPHHERYKDSEYYFCCASCLMRFIANPAQFLGKAAKA